MNKQTKINEKINEQEMESSLTETATAKSENSGVVAVNLTHDVGIGMSKVDPIDIRPPQILLIQDKSNLESFSDIHGNHPKAGQFFHNGKLAVLDFIDCYFIFAAKTKYTDKRKPEKGEQMQYKAIGALAEDLSIFGMTFKSSALYTLSPIFTAVIANKRPMFSIRCVIEKKEISGKMGSWLVPVLRITGLEEDPEKLKQLKDLALQFDIRADKVAEEEPEEEAEY